MYCIKCGVNLNDSQKSCPLCGTVVFHPDLTQPEGERLYPRDRYPKVSVNRSTVMVVISAFFLTALLITALVDIQISGGITWSGYVIGALAVSYAVVVLPGWFRHANPIVFVPVDFCVVGLYVLYIDLVNSGGWFLGFALPVIGALGLITTAVVVLMRCVPRGRFFIFGGASMALGAFMPVMELLLKITFRLPKFYAWSLYPLVVLAILGGVLIYLGCSLRAREAMERKLFL